MTQHTDTTSSSLWAVVKSSLSGEEHDFTQGNIRRAVFLLAIPMILELSLESVFALVDMFFVSKLGENALATVGLTESMLMIVYSLGIGLGIGITAIVSRRTGEKNPEAAAHAGAQSIVFALLVTVVISIVGLVFAADFLRLLGATSDVVEEGVIFTRIMLGGSLVIIFLFLINGIFRGVGNAAMAMKSLALASFINIILCPIFIHFFQLKGAAIATVIGRGIGVLYQCYHLFKGNKNLKMRWHHFRYDGTIIKSIINISSPATLQFFIGSGSWIMLYHLIIETGGKEALAGYQVAIRCIGFFILPAWGLSNAAATLVGQNLGANQVERARLSVNIITRYNIIFMGAVMLLFLFLSHHIIGFFTPDPKLIYYGSQALQIIGAGYIFYGIGMVMTQALNGAGDSKTPTLINLVCFWFIQIPFAYTLALGFDLQTTGAFVAIPVAETLIALSAWYYFRKGNWATKKV